MDDERVRVHAMMVVKRGLDLGAGDGEAIVEDDGRDVSGKADRRPRMIAVPIFPRQC